MRIFSDELREWAEYTYEVFVPERVRDFVYDATHDVRYIEVLAEDAAGDEYTVGEFSITYPRIGSNPLSATFVPNSEPVRQWNVPLNVLDEALTMTTYEDVEQALIAADEHSVLLGDE